MAKELTPETPILLVQKETPEKNNLKVVKGMDKKGNLQAVEPEKAKQGDFLSIDKSGDFLENFFKNFLKQAEDPKHLGVVHNLHKFYVVTYGMLKDAIHMTSDQLEKFRVKPEDYINQQKGNELKPEVDKHTEQKPGQEPEINNPKNEQIMEQQQEKNEQQHQEFKQFDVSRIPESEYKELGITPESMGQYMNQMSWGFKSKDLIELHPKVGGIEVSIPARLSLVEQPDGNLKLIPHPYQEKADVKSPFQGIILPEDVQKNLLETGHGGKVVNLEPEPGKIVPALLSVDKLTNRIEAVPVESLNFKKILGVELKPEQEDALKRGEKVFIEGMTSKNNGKVFDNHVQFNAAKGQLDFARFGKKNKQEQSQEQGQGQQGELKPRKVGEVWVRPVQAGVPLSKDQFEKICKGDAIWIEGLERKPKQEAQKENGVKQTEATDKKGHKYNAWVWIDPEKGHVRHTSKLPEHIKPAAGYETQVAVNSQGKTNEATKHTQEPLQKGQTRPTEKQEQKKEQKEQQQEKKTVKKKGVTM